ncbi:phosphopentomutase [Lacibacterium aquatile]|uniref:Phosphopentomutase n=1 Tax=Lacibacterium aquatile TaxID=1168082 RepID=A0ABW5DLE4_9PROT
MSKRAIILVMDSFGIGATPDAASFGDTGADTIGHIAAARAARGNPLKMPNLEALGLGAAARHATGRLPAGFTRTSGFTGGFAAARERSLGKDTPSGHWELAGVPVEFEWGYFPKSVPSFPAELTNAIIAEAGLPGILGNCHASGTTIIADLGEEHVRTGKPIFYTSADSVLQIAAHEESFGLDRLYALCKIAYQHVQPYNIGRVIARPFVGAPGSYTRTGNRKDLAVPPPSKTLLNQVSDKGGKVIAIGKVGDIYAHQGVTQVVKATGHEALWEKTLTALDETGDGDLIFTNFVEFDQSFGHRRNIEGYAAALEEFDAALPAFVSRLREGDLVMISADHGCDPTWPGSDHTREHVPLIFFGPAAKPGDYGVRSSFADGGQTIAQHLGLSSLGAGKALF